MIPPDAAAAPEPEPRPARRSRRRWLGGLGAAALSPWLTLGALSLLHDGPEPAVVASDRPPPPAAPAAGGPSPGADGGTDGDGDGLDDALEAAVARRHAPRYRFAGRDPAGLGGAQNRDEAYFPMSVRRFLACLEAGVWQRAEGAVQVEAGGRPPSFEAAHLRGFPSRVVGDPVGTAPLYTHVYPADAPGEVFCEYWVFYAYDRAEAVVLGFDVPLGDHRCDWEHTAYRVRLDPPALLESYSYGHGHCLVVPREDLQVVEGTHPVVYVSQGKHASYPAPCVVPSTALPTWLVQHHDVANGLGPTWDAWRGPLVSLGERGQPTPAVARWQHYLGRWGPDGVTLGGLVEIGASPTGPLAKESWRNNGAGVPWRQDVLDRGGVLLRGER